MRIGSEVFIGVGRLSTVCSQNFTQEPAGCLPSSLDSKAEERKYVPNFLKANGYTKTFLRNCQKPVTTSNALDEREPATGFAVIPYIQGVTEPIKRILNSHNVKVAQKSSSDFGAYFCQT